MIGIGQNTMRNGDEAVVLGKIPGPTDSDYCCIGYLWDGCQEKYRHSTWRMDGRNYALSETDFDIISQRKQIWLNMYRDGFTYHDSLKEADDIADKRERLECVYLVELREGEKVTYNPEPGYDFNIDTYKMCNKDPAIVTTRIPEPTGPYCLLGYFWDINGWRGGRWTLDGKCEGCGEGHDLMVPRKEYWVNEYKLIIDHAETTLSFHNSWTEAQENNSLNFVRQLHMVELREGEEIIDV